MTASSGTHRAVSLLLVLVLHALLVLALLRFMVNPQHSPFRTASQTELVETIINTAHAPKPEIGKAAPASTPRAVHPLPQAFSPREPSPATVPVPAPDLRGFGQALADCVPQNFVNLDDAQRTACRKLGASASLEPGVTDFADHRDQVPGAERWARELARKQAPLLLPCGNASALDPVYTSGCILETIANGFSFKKQYENQPAYFDKPGKSSAGIDLADPALANLPFGRTP